MRKTNRLAIVLVLLLLPIAGCGGLKDEEDRQLDTHARAVVDRARRSNETLAVYYDDAVAYAVFPKVAKGAFIVGGAHGKGLVYERRRVLGDRVIGRTTITEGSLGLQIGGQTFSEIVFFEDDLALERFRKGNVELSAAASGVIGEAGATAKAEYEKGVAVFVLGQAGVMAEAAVGGQGFSFEPIP